ncbi:MAG: histidine kinase [Actinomycetota bacterium]
MIDLRPTSVWTWVRADDRRFDVAVALFTVVGASLLIRSAPERFDTGWPEVVAGIGAFGLLVVRRWKPALLLVIAMAWIAIHVGIWARPTPMVFAALVLMATLCVRLDRWPAIGLSVAVAASMYFVGLISNDVEQGDARAVIGIVWTAFVVGGADAVRSWRRYRESAEAQVRSAILASEAEARQQVSQERLDIARELHDLLAHNLSVMNVQTGAALHLLRSDPDQAEQSLVAARDAGRSVLDELRELLAVLRHTDAELDDGAPTSALPTVDQLDGLVDTMRATGLDVTWHREGAPRELAPAVSLAAYRIAQEALTNAAKHGDGHVRLETRWGDDGLDLLVTNGTSGPEVETAGGHGLIGMRERATLNGGRLTMSNDDDRFEVTAWLPAAALREDA